MKVLVVSQYFWPETFIINDLVQLLQDRGVEMTVLTGKPNYPSGRVFEGYRMGGLQRETLGQVKVVRVPLYPRGQRSTVGLALNYLSFIVSCILHAPRALKDVEVDLVFVYALSPLLQALSGVWIARRRRVPLVVWVQDLWPESLSATGHVNSPWLLSVVARVVRRIYRACHRILVQSRAFVNPVASLTDLPEKIHYYPNLYLPPVVAQGSGPAHALATELKGCFSVVFAGNLGTAQALDTIVDAAERLKFRSDIRVFLVGSGSMDAWLAHQVTVRSLDNLRLCGRFDTTDMPTLFDAASALLVSLNPDPIFALTVPSKLQAYLAAGRPILASLDGEGARIVEEAGAGFSSPAGDVLGLVESILRLADCPTDVRLAMGESGRRYFDVHFAPDFLADQLIEHFRQTISAGRNKS